MRSAQTNQDFTQALVKSYALPNSYWVNNATVSVVDTAAGDADDGPSGVPVAIMVSSVLSAVAILVGMVLFTRWVGGLRSWAC